ncbi:MAG: spore coat protein [Clostridiales bacterium]|nr:spore coat protein [Clostridiales bacterium]
MQYDNDYDLDHNDCPEYENEVPEEFASDFIVETDVDGYDEYPQTPDDYIGNSFGSDEQAATTDLSGLYENEDDGYDSDGNGNGGNGTHKPCNGDSCNIDYETAEDYTNDFGAPTYGSTDKSVLYGTPEDEQAATSDNWCNCGNSCGCGESAQEKCQLDDYEIISDVLGSEKEIVRLYSSALCETAEENLRDIIRDNFTEAAADQYKAFSYMQENGMYKTEQASEEDITKAKQQFAPLCRNNSDNY